MGLIKLRGKVCRADSRRVQGGTPGRRERRRVNEPQPFPEIFPGGELDRRLGVGREAFYSPKPFWFSSAIFRVRPLSHLGGRWAETGSRGGMPMGLDAGTGSGSGYQSPFPVT